jgi:hypothetical protein
VGNLPVAPEKKKTRGHEWTNIPSVAFAADSGGGGHQRQPLNLARSKKTTTRLKILIFLIDLNAPCPKIRDPIEMVD